MSYTLNNIYAVTRRVLRQLAHDRRFLGLSLAAPLLIMLMLKVFFDSAPSPSPLFRPTQFVVPVSAFIVHFLTYILCAIVLVRERTAQTLSRMFINGYRPIEIISGYLLAYTVLATVQSLLVLIGLKVLFSLDYELGTLVALYFIIWLMAVISIALGVFISNFARNEGQVFPFIPLIILPSVFFSGVIVPVDRMPQAISWLGLATPMYYANQVIQMLIKPGSAQTYMAANLAGLVAYGVIVLAMATFTLREME